MALDFLQRENEILAALERFTAVNVDFVLVGGYAVSARAQHRFSRDCDIILPKTEAPKVRTILAELGYRTEKVHEGFDEIYGGSFERYLKAMREMKVSFDLLIESLVCKETAASWSFREIKRDSSDLKIPGLESSTKSRVASKEFLIAFKLHAGRKTDARDIAVLSEGANWEKVTRLSSRGELSKVIKHTSQILSFLRNSNMIDSLKGVFSIQEEVTEQLAHASSRVEEMVAELKKNPL